jgi:uncharacterized protein YecT (DUF1311 family)
MPRLVLFLTFAGILLSGVTAHGLALVQEVSQEKQAQEEQQQQADEQAEPAAIIDKAVFLNPIPADQLAFLKEFDGAEANKLVRDKRFHTLMHSVIPDCMFHYGRDMPLTEAMDTVLKGSSERVQIRDGRYLMVAGHMGPYLAGKGFIWIDIQEGVALGGFYFHPTNGEPTPAVNVFSRQLRDEFLSMGQLPAEFSEELSEWSAESRVPQVTTRYFITGANRKILLEHDEDYCATVNGVTLHSPSDCQQMNADAADLDMTAAYYLEQTHHVTNATAWMISQDQIAWTRVRDNTCRIGINPLLCRITITREHVHVIIGRRTIVRPRVRVTRK